jgi:hypothetical protein
MAHCEWMLLRSLGAAENGRKNRFNVAEFFDRVVSEMPYHALLC